MELIKKNAAKHRAVYQTSDKVIRKYWYNKDLTWLNEHVNLLKSVVPNYLINYGGDDIGMWIDMHPLTGTPANTIPHTKEFVKQIYDFCLRNIEETAPYAHGDWVLSNMFVNGNNILLCDWDNIGIYLREEVTNKLHSDLRSAFGDLFDEVINDSAIV
tara:strand:- start:3554 stop:4027 length:474 start_codon:yes stop_codon:yes gene_type:complete